MSTKLVLPSVKELEQQWVREIADFCSRFTDGITSYTWKGISEDMTIIARFERKPLLYVGNVKYELPNYGEDLEEVVSCNWGYIRNKIPKAKPGLLARLVEDYLKGSTPLEIIEI